jgi:hypothetical protein
LQRAEYEDDACHFLKYPSGEYFVITKLCLFPVIDKLIDFLGYLKGKVHNPGRQLAMTNTFCAVRV